MHVILLLYVILAAIALRILYPVLAAATASTRHIPGPFLARFTRLWYLHSVYKGTAEKDHYALHRKYAKNGEFYAPIVRLGPNMFSIAEPDKQVYGISSKMRKSDWYEGWKHPSPDRWTMFPDRDIKRHNETRKKMQNLYSLSSLTSYEQYVDNCMLIFQDRLKEIAASGKFVDFTHWLQCYAFDVIGEITWSKRFGFLDEGRDVEGIMKALDKNMPYSTLVGIYAWLHPYLFEIMQRIPGSGAAGRIKLMGIAHRNKAEREQARKSEDSKSITVEDVENGKPEDFLEKMLRMKKDEKKGVTDYHCFIMGLSNIIAGADTTAVSLSSTLYHLIKTPRAMRKLREEVRNQTDQGLCETDRVSFKASQEMPYLQACMKEALRLHAAVGLPLWRTTNEGITEICGERFPAGSEIGINAWVAHYNEDIWGTDAAQFRPERWLEAEAEEGERLKIMEHHYLPFGLGSRTCIGRHISYLEMTKLVPQIVRTFDFELQFPDQDWKCLNYWFVKPADFHLRIKTLEKQG